ncbi:MAG: SlyX family protein [Gammaproteobacteria bacterium]|nr:SlyX family protein [Gammaproteobacteria bacterium]
MSDEQRLAELESRIAFQEDGIQSLSDLIHQQQQQLDRLKALCDSLTQRYQTLAEEPPENPANERPPHY